MLGSGLPEISTVAQILIPSPSALNPKSFSLEVKLVLRGKKAIATATAFIPPQAGGSGSKPSSESTTLPFLT